MTTPAPLPVNRYLYDAGRMANERLNELLAAYDDAADAADAAKARLGELTQQIKAELTAGATRADGTPYERYVLMGAQLAKPLKLSWVVTNRLDTKALKAEMPEVAAAYSRASGTWRLERDRG